MTMMKYISRSFYKERRLYIFYRRNTPQEKVQVLHKERLYIFHRRNTSQEEVHTSSFITTGYILIHIL